MQDFLVFTENQSIELRIFNQGTFNADSLLCRARLPVRSVLGEHVEVALQGPDGNPTEAALALQASWLSVVEGGAAPEPGSDRFERGAGAGHSHHGDADRNAALAQEVFNTLPVFASDIPVHATPAPAQDPETLVSVRVDGVAGLPERGRQRLRFSVRASAGGRSSETDIGRAPETSVSVIGDEAFVTLARRLAPHVSAEGLAEALEVSPEHARELLERENSPGRPQDSGSNDATWIGDWCRRARSAARLLAASRNPQFGHICHLPIDRPSELLLELVCHGEGSRRTQVVGRLSHDLAAIASAGGLLKGPFPLHLADGSECCLEGSVHVRRLELQDLGKP